jgi:hypothetical protein
VNVQVKDFDFIGVWLSIMVSLEDPGLNSTNTQIYMSLLETDNTGL